MDDIEDLQTVYQATAVSETTYRLAKEKKWRELSGHLESRLEELDCAQFTDECTILLLHLSGSKAKEAKFAEAKRLLLDLETELQCGSPDEQPLCDFVRKRKASVISHIGDD